MNIMKNVAFIYSNNIKENFEAIRKTDKGVTMNYIIDGEFVDYGFISQMNIKEIKNYVKYPYYLNIEFEIITYIIRIIYLTESIYLT